MPVKSNLAKKLIFALAFILLPTTAVSAQKVSPGSACKLLNLKIEFSKTLYTCVRSGKRLVWDKGVAVSIQAPRSIPTPTPTASPAASVPTPTPKPTTTQINYYVAKAQKTVRHLKANEGCANPANATAQLQVLIEDKWLPVKPIGTGWEVFPKSCPIAQLGKKDSLATADVYLDEGVTFRWYFTGEVNILHHDNLGNGFSESQNIPSFVIPHPVDNKYGITWQNITSRVKDISAAAYSDAQATIARNQSLPNAGDVFTTYISPGAMQIYPQAENGPKLMKRTFSLFAKYPHAKQVFYVATTLEEKAQTFAKLDAIYPSSPFMKNSISDMDGTNTNQPAGSVFVRPTCQGTDTGRQTRFWEQNTISASAVVWNFCPITNQQQSHIESDHGAAHEYAHTIQAQLYSEKQVGTQPCWMTEGEVEWAQTAVSSDFSEYLSMQHFHPYYLTFFGLEFSQPTQTIWTVSEIDSYLKEAVIMPCHLTRNYALAYSLGTATIEALVAIGGSESFFAVDQRIAGGEYFVEAFEEVYGVSWDYAEPILADVVAQKLTLAQSKDALTYQTRP